MRVSLATSRGTVDLSRRVSGIQWGGNSGRLSRELSVQMAVSPTDPEFAALDIAMFCPICLYDGEGTLLIAAYVVKVSRSSGSNAMTVTALDRGLWLANNQGYYNFTAVTPEQATRTVCGDFGVPVGSLPGTGVTLKRKFPGVALHDILRTLWYQAGEQNGKRYHLGFAGNTLEVKEKPLTATAILAPKVNLQASSITRDGTGYHNAVAIYSEQGTPIRTIFSDKASFDLEGTMQRVMIQRAGENMEAKARAQLEEDEIKQTVQVTAVGDTVLQTGGAVSVQLTTSGVEGLFWIESDSHRWSGGAYETTMELNFKNLMQKAEAGTESG